MSLPDWEQHSIPSTRERKKASDRVILLYDSNTRWRHSRAIPVLVGNGFDVMVHR